ncbi:NAD(P)-binding Rossmann-fold superfamily protein [Striga asiatica]|uniref:NAD(P)-binding Rossmann-fold superfamily protein n=1 Tax=Striga asiatica TaxID=4170 RepID=A0A5A7REJ0_STRAF|nr:NAD(P)-binding Rossmann-fold superfamily protein [Striga asiatica]
MELYGATSISWANSISSSHFNSFHESLTVRRRFKRITTLCVSSGKDEADSQKVKNRDALFICLLVIPFVQVREYPGIVIAEEADWKNCIQGSTAVVNLAGLPISTRWSPEVCREWENTALRVNKDVRPTLIRIGVVLGKDGGALAKMIPLFMMFAGGPLGSGKQWFSWIHVDDLVSLIFEAIRNPSYKGVINGTAPNPVRLSEMCDHLGSVLGRPSWLPVPDIALKAVLGEGACVVLDGQKVLPTKAKKLGFSFKYPYVKDALRSIVPS